VEIYASAGEVDTAVGVDDAIDRLSGSMHPKLVISDVNLGDGTGFDLLEKIHAMVGPRPSVILLTEHPRADEEIRAKELGALGYLAKPINVRDLYATLRSDDPSWRAYRDSRHKSHGVAVVKDMRKDAGEVVMLDICDVSLGGAYLETPAPMPIATKLDLELVFGPVRIPAKAAVVRIQERSWATPGGIAVRFLELSAMSKSALETYVESNVDYVTHKRFEMHKGMDK